MLEAFEAEDDPEYLTQGDEPWVTYRPRTATTGTFHSHDGKVVGRDNAFLAEISRQQDEMRAEALAGGITRRTLADAIDAARRSW